MLTNQQLVVAIPGGTLRIDHKTSFGVLQDVFAAGNITRVQDGLPIRDVADWTRHQNTKEFIEYVSEEIGEPAVKSSKGRASTKAHLYVLLDAAAYLHPKVKLHIYKVFVEQKLLFLRDLGGDNFIDLNATLTVHADDVLGKPAHKGHYIQLAKIIKEKCGVDDWNIAEPFQHETRARCENVLSTMLRTGVVQSWDHLKELAAKI